MTCTMLQSLAVKNAPQTLKKFIPWLHRNITNIVKENPEVLEDQYKTDCELKWNVSQVIYLISAAGEDLLPWMDKIHDILEIVNQLKEINGIRMCTKIYTSLIQSLGTFYMYRRNQREGVLRDPDPSLAAITQWGATFTIREMKGRLDKSWHEPSEAEENEIFKISRQQIEPSMAELRQIIDDKSQEVDQIRIKQIMARLIGFLSGIQAAFVFDHGDQIPLDEKYESVILGDYPTMATPQSDSLKSQLGHLPKDIFKLMQDLLVRLEEPGDISEYRVLRIVLITMSFCFNYKQRDDQSAITVMGRMKLITFAGSFSFYARFLKFKF